MPFHENLRTLRLARGLTQPKLAEKADIEQSYLSKLENGRSQPSPEVLARLATSLETDPEALANGDDDTRGHPRLRWTIISAGLLATLIIAFFIGRITAIYPLSFAQLITGKSRTAEVTRSLLLLAPQNVDVGTISAEPNALFIMGTTPDRPTLEAYLQTLQSHYGGEFPTISISPEHPGEPRHFMLRYKPDWSRIEVKANVADHPASG